MLETEDLDVKDPVTGDPSTSTDDNSTADPSKAEGDKKTLADVVRETAAASGSATPTDEDGGEDAAEDPSKAEGDKTEPADKAKDGEEKEPVVADEKDKQLPFHKHPRFQEVIKERASFKQKSEELTPLAERAKSIDGYCQKYGISGEEFNTVLELTALTHVNPSEALKSLRAYVDTLEVSLGNKLPDDLQKEVDDGALSMVRAKELTNARIKNQGLEHTTKRSEAQVAQERQAAITGAVNAWDSQKRTTDVAYDKKYPLIEKAFVAECTLNPPRTPQEAVLLAEKAYKTVNDALGSLTPKPPVRRVLRPNGSVTKGSIEIKPGMPLKDALRLIAQKVVAESVR